jgi:hypothetical protein
MGKEGRVNVGNGGSRVGKGEGLEVEESERERESARERD